MTKVMWAIIALQVTFLVYIVGCVDSSRCPQVQVVEQLEGRDLKVTELGSNFGRWRLIELRHQDTDYVFLQNYDSNNQGLVKVTEHVHE